MKKRILHVITGLATGGAETQLVRVLKGIDQDEFELKVISLDVETALSQELIDAGISVDSLCMKQKPWRIFTLRQTILDFNPDVMHCTMEHGYVIGTCIRASLLFSPLRQVPLVWAIHTPLDSIQFQSLQDRFLTRSASVLSHFADSIIYVSQLNAQQHHKAGHVEKDDRFMPNGIGMENYYRDQDAGRKIRQELGVDDSTFLIGKVARYHPQKNHEGFIRAAALLCEIRSDVEFVLVGEGLSASNTLLVELIHQCGIQDKIHLVGRRSDIMAFNNAMDVATLTSIGEAFPLVLVEAMATETPCVATDVGDVAHAIGDTGYLVEPENDIGMAESWNNMISLPVKEREALGKAARQRCFDYFTLEQQVEGHESLYRELTQPDYVLT